MSMASCVNVEIYLEDLHQHRGVDGHEPDDRHAFELLHRLLHLALPWSAVFAGFSFQDTFSNHFFSGDGLAMLSLDELNEEE
jgi:hypothetical protein